MSEIEDDELDGCDIDFTECEQADDETVELMPLFADALDPDTPSTIEEAAEFWRQYAVPHRDT